MKYALMVHGYRVQVSSEADLSKRLDEVAHVHRVITLLCANYLMSPGCCAVFCEAVEYGIEVIPVIVDGSKWDDLPFPDVKHVLEKITLEERNFYPRAAAEVVFGMHIAIEHKQSYFPDFMKRVVARLGPVGALRRDVLSDPFDAFLSHKRSDCQDLVARVHDKLTDAGAPSRGLFWSGP